MLVVLLLLIHLYNYLSIKLTNRLTIYDLSSHLIPYEQALHWQSKLQNRTINYFDKLIDRSIDSYIDRSIDNEHSHHLILLQHRSVYTLGSSSQSISGPFNKQLINNKILDYEVVNVKRGGQTTYHGPGQLVAYPIIDLNQYNNDIHVYLRKLEKVIIDTLSYYQINAGLIPGLTGVWVNDKKIAAIGVSISRWVSMHGLAINVNPDLDYFLNIQPCGLNKGVCSVHDFNTSISLSDITNTFIDKFIDEFSITQSIVYNNYEIIDKLTDN